MKTLNLNKTIAVTLLLGVTLLASSPAFAGTGTAMPWDGGLQALVTNLTGRTALAIGVLAMFAAAAALVFGGEMSEFTRRIILMVLAVAVMISGAALMTTFFGVSAALIPLAV